MHCKQRLRCTETPQTTLFYTLPALRHTFPILLTLSPFHRPCQPTAQCVSALHQQVHQLVLRRVSKRRMLRKEGAWGLAHHHPKRLHPERHSRCCQREGRHHLHQHLAGFCKDTIHTQCNMMKVWALEVCLHVNSQAAECNCTGRCPAARKSQHQERASSPWSSLTHVSRTWCEHGCADRPAVELVIQGSNLGTQGSNNRRL